MPRNITADLDYNQIRRLNHHLRYYSDRQLRRGLQRTMVSIAQRGRTLLKKRLQAESTFGHSMFGHNRMTSFVPETDYYARWMRRGSLSFVSRIGIRRGGQATIPYKAGSMWHRIRRASYGLVARFPNYWHLMNLGTKPHYQPGLRWRHPGARAHNVVDRVIQRIQRYNLRALILKEMDRLLTTRTRGRPL